MLIKREYLKLCENKIDYSKCNKSTWSCTVKTIQSTLWTLRQDCKVFLVCGEFGFGLACNSSAFSYIEYIWEIVIQEQGTH